jgi:hypothetical protein
MNGYNTMKKVSADPGEMVYDFLDRCLFDAEFNQITIEATHNHITIKVYPDSSIRDLCDKYDLTSRYK